MHFATLTPLRHDIARRLLECKAIAIRATRRDDRQRIVRAFHDLDRESIYQRFFFPKRELNERELRQITECDGVRSAVLVATVCIGGEEIIVGLGQYFKRGAVAEVAFVVAEAFRGRGIASRLLRRLACKARGAGVSHFGADVLAGNRPMLDVFRHSGLPIQENSADGVVHVTMSLGDARH